MSHAFLARLHRLPLVVAASLAVCGATASAGPAVVSISGGSNFISFDGSDMTVGWAFSLASGTDVTVTRLGWWDQTPATPLGSSHLVGIWSSTGSLLGSVTVLANSSLSGAFRYEATTPFVLTGGGDYLIGGEVTSPYLDFYSVPTSLVTDSLITVTGSARNASSGGFSAPTTVTAGNGRFGPNFEFTVNSAGTVPEPSALLIALTGLGLMASFGRRRGAATTA